MPHKFAIGDRVRFHHERNVSAAHGAYLVTMQLPERDGEERWKARHSEGGWLNVDVASVRKVKSPKKVTGL